jgi:hypothetical protein
VHKYVAGIAVSLMVALGTLQAEPLVTSGAGLGGCQKLAADLKPDQGLNSDLLT